MSCLSYAWPNNGKGYMSKYIFVHCPPIHCLKAPKLSPLIHLVTEVFRSRRVLNIDRTTLTCLKLGEQPVLVTLFPRQIQHLKTLFLRYIKHTYPLQKSLVNAAGSEIHTNYRITYCGQKLLHLNVKTCDI